MTTDELAELIDRRYKELLDDAQLPACEACGRKPMTPTQTIQALAGAARWIASRTGTPNGGETAGSGFEEDGGEG